MLDPNRLDILDEPPTAAELVAMRDMCGWGLIAEDVARRALDAALMAVSIRQDGALLACGRVVGDGVLSFYVEDVIVTPEARGHGLGRIVVERLMSHIRADAPSGATIGLMCAAGKEGFYERFGFASRPAPHYGAGMTQFIG